MEDIVNQLIERLKTSNGRLVTYDNKKRIDVPFSELYEKVKNVAIQLDDAGFKQGDVVGVVFSKSLGTILLDLALGYLGVKSLPINDIANLSFLKGDKAVGNRVILSKGDETHISECEESQIKMFFIDELRKDIDDRALERHSFSDDEVFAYKSTSGSTGIPKIIGHLKGALNNSLENVQKLFQHEANDNILVFLPLELLQQRYWIYSAIYYGFTVTVVPKEMVFYALQVEKPTVLMGIPFLYETLMNEFNVSLKNEKLREKLEQFKNSNSKGAFPEFHEVLGGNIRYMWTGSAPISKSCLEFYDLMGIPLLQGYGMNETCIISKNHPKANKIGTVGPIFPNVEFKLDDNHQILVKPKNPICSEYAFNSGDNSAFHEDGFFATGDLGKIDDEGYLSIIGRMKDLIVLSTSKKVNPRYVEEQIEKHHQIEKCIVYGDEKPYLIALIQPWAKDIDRSELAQLIDAYNQSARDEEKVFKFHILEEKITEKERFISNQNKIKRNEVYTEYTEQINELYA